MTKNERIKLHMIAGIIIEAHKEGIDLSTDQIDELWSGIKIKKLPEPVEE